MEPEVERGKGAESGAEGGRETAAEGESSKVGSQRVEQLSRFLRHQQEVVYK